MILKNKSILVTGGCGFIGSHLVERLVREGPEKICIIDNLFLGKERNLDDAKSVFGGIKFFNGDASDFGVLKSVVVNEGVDMVFDLAAMPLPASLINPSKVIKNNFDIAMNLVEMFKDGLFKEFIHYSTSEAYGSAKYVPMDEDHPLDPMNPYGAGKAGIDHFLLAYNKVFGLKTKIVRPFNNFGPRQNEDAYAGVIPVTIRRILEDKAPILYGDGRQTRDYIYVKDTAEATVRIAKEKSTEGKVINVARGKEVEIKWLIRTIANLLGSKKLIIQKPPRPSDVRRHLASNVLLKKLTGYIPETTIEEGLKETIKWYKKILLG